MYASEKGCIASINYLLENGADLNHKSEEGLSAIEYAKKENKKNPKEVIKLLKSKMKK